MKKGISPLIAIVIIVAFTIAIASIITIYLTEFTREQTSSQRTQGDDVLDCGAAAIEITDVNKDSDDLIVNVRNVGNQEFSELTLTVRNTSTSALVSIDTNETLKETKTKSLIVDSWGTQGIYEVTVNTDCPGIYSTSRNQSGTFNEVFS